MDYKIISTGINDTILEICEKGGVPAKTQLTVYYIKSSTGDTAERNITIKEISWEFEISASPLQME